MRAELSAIVDDGVARRSVDMPMPDFDDVDAANNGKGGCLILFDYASSLNFCHSYILIFSLHRCMLIIVSTDATMAAVLSMEAFDTYNRRRDQLIYILVGLTCLIVVLNLTLMVKFHRLPRGIVSTLLTSNIQQGNHSFEFKPMSNNGSSQDATRCKDKADLSRVASV